MLKIKLLVLLLLTVSFSVSAMVFYIQTMQSQNGYWYSRIHNQTTNTLYCRIGYSSFYVNPQSVSNWYAASTKWQCKYI